MAEVAADPVPLVAGPEGVMRIQGTRVTLDTVVAAFQDGATPEEIVQQYPSISLADAYHVIGYCLRHATDVEAYLARREESNRHTRQQNEFRWPGEGIRSRLLARRKA